MRRSVVASAVVGLVLAIAFAPLASADIIRTCPAEESGFVRYEIHGQIGNPAPDPGDEPLWDRFAIDAVTAFGSLEALIEAFGFESEADLYAFLLGGWYGWDKNGDDHICIQDFPDTPGTPAYIWNGIDNSARVRR